MDDLPTACYACGREGTLAGGARCDCGEPRWLATDAAGVQWPASDHRGKPNDDDATAQSLWRYADLLPVDPGQRVTGVAAAAGGTPLYRTPRLDDAGCRLHVKDETANPTGSFKDRGSAVGVAVAASAATEGAATSSTAEAGADDWVATVSHGNMARSVAAMAAGSGLDCVVLVPADVPDERLAPIARYGPRILRVAGDYGRLYRETLAVGRDTGLPVLNSDVPLRVAGQKTVAFEVVEAFAGANASGDESSVPDAVVLPVSSGGNASAVWKGLRELRAAGHIDDLPRVYLTQAAACDPIARAYRRGDDSVTALSDGETGETAAYSIANADPPSGTRALAAVRATGGAVVSVSESALLDGQSVLAQRAGVAVEPASATALAGLRKLTASGDDGRREISDDENVVLVATGTVPGSATTAGSETTAGANVETVELDDVAARLRSLAS